MSIVRCMLCYLVYDADKHRVCPVCEAKAKRKHGFVPGRNNRDRCSSCGKERLNMVHE